MINDYLYTIGKYISPAQRDEVLREIESNLFDFLEQNFGQKEYTESEIEKAIRSMGHPKKVAEAYMESPRCLIGPAYIDTYWLVMKIALIGIAIGLTITNILTISDAKDGIQIFVQVIASVWNASLSAIGSITLIFALIQHFSPGEQETITKDWSLESIEKAPETHQKVSILELIIESIFICLFLILINQAAPTLAIAFPENNIIPILDMTLFKPFLIWINITMISNLTLNLYLLIKRRWQSFTRVIAIVIDIISVGIFTKLIMTPGLWDFKTLDYILKDDGVALETVLDLSLNLTLAVVVIIVAIDIFGHLRAMMKTKSK
ncbi:MAG: hypothetical protein IBX70_11530 [Clostridia bacterium]|nr:hypothetical protein [Clostridia bacterium]